MFGTSLTYSTCAEAEGGDGRVHTAGDDVEAVAVMLLRGRNPIAVRLRPNQGEGDLDVFAPAQAGFRNGGVVDQRKRHRQSLTSSETARPRGCQWRPYRPTVMTTIAGDT